MNKHDQTNVLGIGTTPDRELDMNLFVPSDIIFIEVKDRSQQSLTTKELEPVEDTEYKDLIATEILVVLCVEQESLIEEQEARIHDLEKQLQDYEQEIYEKDRIYYDVVKARPRVASSTCKLGEGYTGGNLE